MGPACEIHYDWENHLAAAEVIADLIVIIVRDMLKYGILFYAVFANKAGEYELLNQTNIDTGMVEKDALHYSR